MEETKAQWWKRRLEEAARDRGEEPAPEEPSSEEPE